MVQPIIIIGPSGAGKSTLLELLLPRESSLELVRTVTTRPKRSYEDNYTHEFVDVSTFETMKQQNEFLGTVSLFGYDYGLPQLVDNKVRPIFLLRASIIPQMKYAYPRSYVIQLEAPLDVLKQRITHRGDLQRFQPSVLTKEIEEGRALADLIIDTSMDPNTYVDTVLHEIRASL